MHPSLISHSKCSPCFSFHGIPASPQPLHLTTTSRFSPIDSYEALGWGLKSLETGTRQSLWHMLPLRHHPLERGKGGRVEKRGGRESHGQPTQSSAENNMSACSRQGPGPAVRESNWKLTLLPSSSDHHWCTCHRSVLQYQTVRWGWGHTSVSHRRKQEEGGGAEGEGEHKPDVDR